MLEPATRLPILTASALGRHAWPDCDCVGAIHTRVGGQRATNGPAACGGGPAVEGRSDQGGWAQRVFDGDEDGIAVLFEFGRANAVDTAQGVE